MCIYWNSDILSSYLVYYKADNTQRQGQKRNNWRMASKEKSTKGYELDLFLNRDEIPPKYLCSACGCVAKDIQMVQCCRKQVCHSCIQPHLELPCPYCKEEDFDIVPLKKESDKIANFRVYCTEKGSGCDWTGSLKDLEDHLHKEQDGCQHSPKECPNCHTHINRGEMTDHLRKECPKREYRCPHCNYQGTYDFVTEGHMPECSFCPVACPYLGCGVTGEREVMEDHIKNKCPEQHIECGYKYAGCEVKYRRKNEEEHMKLYREQHRMMYEPYYLRSMEEWKKHQKESQQLEEQRREGVTARVRQVEELERKNTELERRLNEVVQENQQRRAAMNELKQKVDKLEGQLLEQEKRFDEQIQQLRQELNNSKPSQPAAQAAAVLPQLGKGKPNKVLMQQENDQVWEFTVDKFMIRKANQEKWEGPEMTTPLGYSLQVDVWPNGQNEGKGTHMSVWMQYVYKAEDKKKWPAKITMTLEFFNQYRGSEKWQNPIMESFNILCDQYKNRYNCIGTFGDKLISHKTLGENHRKRLQFLKDDSLKLRITLLDERPIEI